MTIEKLREEVTELSTPEGNQLELTRQLTSDQQGADLKEKTEVYGLILENLIAKATAAADEEIFVSAPQYQISAKAFVQLTSGQFSEEAFNAYAHLMRPMLDKNYVLDTMTTSEILANILNAERVREILHKAEIHLNNYHNIIFPVVDIADSGSVQLIIANITDRSVKVVRSDTSLLGFQPADQINDLMSYFISAESEDAAEWTIKENVITSNEESSSLSKVVQRVWSSLTVEVDNVPISTESLVKSILFGELIA